MWPETSEGFSASGTCISGFTGSPSRSCQEEGTWSDLVVNGCQRTRCPAETRGNANWPSTLSGNFVQGTCQAGFVGEPYRQCLSDGTWGPVQDPCVDETIQCPAQTFNNANWPAVNGGSLAQGNCVSGYSGTPSRTCQPGGIWESLVVNVCTSKLPLKTGKVDQETKKKKKKKKKKK